MAKRSNKAKDLPTSTAVEVQKKENCNNDCVVVALNRPQGIVFSLKNGRKVEIFGNAVHLRGKEMGVLPMGGAFGLTPVSHADWKEIKQIYGDTALFKSGRIFAAKNNREAVVQAEDHAETRHGLEPTKGELTTKAENKEVG